MVYIIAEAGLNHNGSVDTAKKMIEVAKECGADCIKFQMYFTDMLCDPKYQPELFRQLSSCQLTAGEMILLRNHCRRVGIDFLCTPDDLESASFLDGIQDRFKISSIGAANLHLLRLVNCFKKPVLISDGLVSEYGIDIAEEILKDCKVTWMKCVSKYPATIDEYEERINAYPYALSDHTEGIEMALLCAKGGTEIIEKHFTLDKTQEGFDHHMSINPEELKELCREVK